MRLNLCYGAVQSMRMRFFSLGSRAVMVAGFVLGQALTGAAAETAAPAAAPAVLPANAQPPLPPPPVPLPRLRQAALAAANNTPGATPPTVAPSLVRPNPAVANLNAVTTTPPSGLGFDSLIKTVEVNDGAPDAIFTFAVTNISKEDITINSVSTSCGCTAAKLPQQPWLLHPGDHGEVGATMHVAGKWGKVVKTLTISSSKGNHMLTVQSILPDPNSPAGQRVVERSRNLQIAAADRQAVFRGDCAKCHVEPTVAKTGKELYVAACGICHDAEHKATMVPTLLGRTGTFDEAYWTQWVRNGKVGSLMPAFEAKQGGPLNDDQIKSLTAYLANDFLLAPVKLEVPAAK